MDTQAVIDFEHRIDCYGKDMLRNVDYFSCPVKSIETGRSIAYITWEEDRSNVTIRFFTDIVADWIYIEYS